MEKFTVWILEELNKKDWKPADLAKKARMSTGALSNIMNGNRKPGPEICRAIAQALDQPPEHVFRLAGLLPPLPSSNNGPILNEIIEIVKRLTDEEKEDVLDYAKLRYEKRGRKKPPTAPVTTRVSRPVPIIEHISLVPPTVPPETVAKLRALVERLTPSERADLIDRLLSRRDFVLALKLRGVEVRSQPVEKTQEASVHKDQE